MVLMAIVCGFALGWTYWEVSSHLASCSPLTAVCQIFRWCSALYYGWTLCHMIPWNVVLVWQTQNATTLLGVPCWTALLVTFAGYFWLGYDVISSVLKQLGCTAAHSRLPAGVVGGVRRTDAWNLLLAPQLSYTDARVRRRLFISSRYGRCRWGGRSHHCCAHILLWF